MEINPHIATAIQTFRESGKEFHDSLCWHLLHGVVHSFAGCFAMGYFCRKDDLETPVDPIKANTIFVSFAVGSMGTIRNFMPRVSFVAFRRGFRNNHPAKVYPTVRFLNLTA